MTECKVPQPSCEFDFVCKSSYFTVDVILFANNWASWMQLRPLFMSHFFRSCFGKKAKICSRSNMIFRGLSFDFFFSSVFSKVRIFPVFLRLLTLSSNCLWTLLLCFVFIVINMLNQAAMSDYVGKHWLYRHLALIAHRSSVFRPAHVSSGPSRKEIQLSSVPLPVSILFVFHAACR